jgi:hypothetical protein
VGRVAVEGTQERRVSKVSMGISIPERGGDVKGEKENYLNK